MGENVEPRWALYRISSEAAARAITQIALYESWDLEGRIRVLKSSTDLDRHLQLWQTDDRSGLILLMEGADPIVEVRDLPLWWRRGLRMIGLTYGDIRYGRGDAGGSSTLKQGA